MSSNPALGIEYTAARLIRGDVPPELFQAIASAVLHHDLLEEAMTARRRDDSPFWRGVLAALINAAAQDSDLLKRITIEAPGLVSDAENHLFLAQYMDRLPAESKERVSIDIATALCAHPPESWALSTSAGGSVSMLNRLVSSIGYAWIPTGAISAIETVLAQSRAAEREPQEASVLADSIRKRKALQNRSTDELLGSSVRTAGAEKRVRRQLALDRARADFIAAGTDKHDALVAWGEVLIELARADTFDGARDHIEHAETLFAEARQIRESPESAAGTAHCVTLSSRPLADQVAAQKLIEEIHVIDEALRLWPSSADLQVAAGLLQYALSERVTDAEQRDNAWKRSRQLLESVLWPSSSDLQIKAGLLQYALSERATGNEQREHGSNRSGQLVESASKPLSRRAILVLADLFTSWAFLTRPTNDGLYSAAEAIIRQLWQSSENDVEALRRAGRIALRRAEMKPWTEAESLLSHARDFFKRALLADPGEYLSSVADADALVRTAQRRSREDAKEVINQAIGQYKSAMELDPQRPNAFIGSGWAELLLARRSSGDLAAAATARARDWANRAIELRPDLADAYRILAIASHRDGNRMSGTSAQKAFTESTDFCNRAIAVRPENPACYIDLGFALLTQVRRTRAYGLLEQAWIAFEAALRIHSSNPEAKTGRADVFRERAVSQSGVEQLRLLEQSVAEYDAVLQAIPDHETALTGRAFALMSMSRHYPGAGDEFLAKAEASCNAALAVRDDNEVAIEALGNVRTHQAALKSGHSAQVLYMAAHQLYERALGIDPDRDYSALQRAASLLRAAEISRDDLILQGAIDAYRKAADHWPEQARMHLGLAKSLMTRLRWGISGDAGPLLAEMLKSFRRAATFDPSDSGIRLDLREALQVAAKVRPENAPTYLDEAAQLDAIAQTPAPSQLPSGKSA